MSPPIRFATVDIGTNSVLLLIAEWIAPTHVRCLEERCLITRLGQGVDLSRRLDPQAMLRTLRALETYASAMDRYHVDERAALGTSALRDATNRQAFLDQCRGVIGCDVEVIDGSREAALVMAGVRGAQDSFSMMTLLLDVGGGSTEFILCKPDRTADVCSLDLGSVRLTERFFKCDPPTAQEQERAVAEIDQILSSLPPMFRQSPKLIGIAGTITTLATVHLGLTEYDASRINELQLTKAHIESQIRRYRSKPLFDRLKIAGLDPGRADIILAGAMIVDRIMTHLGSCTLTVSDKGVRWGLLWELIHKRLGAESPSPSKNTP